MRNLRIYLLLGWRNLWLYPTRTLITLTALTIGIAALTFLSALDDGWMQEIKENFALTFIGHIQVHKRGFAQSERLALRMRDPQSVLDAIENDPAIAAATRRIRVSGLASSAQGNAGCIIIGVVPDRERKISRLDDFVSRGSWVGRKPKGVVVGKDLAEKLELGIGDKLVLMAADTHGNIASEAFRIVGVIHSGVFDIDNLFVLADIQEIGRWLGIAGEATDVVIRVLQHEQVDEVAARLRMLLPPQEYEVLRWSDIDPMADQWAEFADAYSWVILAVVMLVVLAEVLNTMLMSFHDRVRELGLMMALGVRAHQLFAMMIWETLILVSVGSMIGFAFGAGLSFYFGIQGMDLSGYAEAFSFMYISPIVHPTLQWQSVLHILTASLIGALLAGLVPAWRALRLQPVEAIREV